MQRDNEKMIRVKLFGGLREFAPSQESGEILVSAVRSLPELRQALVSFFQESHHNNTASKAAEILKDSVFADERSVLAVDADLEGCTWIAVLPPVCGG